MFVQDRYLPGAFAQVYLREVPLIPHAGRTLTRAVKMLVRVMDHVVLCRRPVGPYLGGPRKDSEVAHHAATTSELYRKTDKVHAWSDLRGSTLGICSCIFLSTIVPIDMGIILCRVKRIFFVNGVLLR
ncbi:hypothetical protein PoB_006951700 [Plakobranchus ocellatus]|uniref:Uncharacterized protein n=1 Tax=Plakobranchus ocellatus TaxID=259542 RepID=A0AAV4DG70_9GAST|nr:hypothetical protein PoB_006951700 [Plakobranchus ocellatus]